MVDPRLLEAQARSGRVCGPCQECCHALPILSTKPPMNKPDLTKCEYQCGRGCRIYETRPEPCRAYFCQWLLGWGTDDWRPDMLGLMLEANARTMCLHVKETQKGACRSAKGLAIIEALTTLGDPMTLDLIGAGAPIFYGTEEQATAFVKILHGMFAERDELLAQVQAEIEKQP